MEFSLKKSEVWSEVAIFRKSQENFLLHRYPPFSYTCMENYELDLSTMTILIVAIYSRQIVFDLCRQIFNSSLILHNKKFILFQWLWSNVHTRKETKDTKLCSHQFMLLFIDYVMFCSKIISRASTYFPSNFWTRRLSLCSVNANSVYSFNSITLIPRGTIETRRIANIKL